MIATPLLLHSIFFFFSVSLLISSISTLNLDGVTLISFKHFLLPHQSSLLQNWNQSDPNPCSWFGVTCAPQTGPVTGLSLPNSHLTGPIPDELARLPHLRVLDLSNNSINGTLPVSIFNCSELETVYLSSNFISGELPEAIHTLQNLLALNLSNNRFSGKLPESLGSLRNLTEVSLNNNLFSGGIPGGFDSVKVLDLSSNSFNGTLPLEFSGGSLNYLNLSNNKISGSVFPKFVENIPANAIVDLSFNNFTGEIPQTLSDRKQDYFAGNLNLCGKPVNKTCTVPSSHSLPPNISSDGSATATAAIAAIPKNAGDSEYHDGRKVNSWKIVAIVAGDVAGMMILAVIFFYAYQFRKKKPNENPKDIVTAAVKFDESKIIKTRSCFGCGTEESSSETATDSELAGNNVVYSDNNHIIGVKNGEEDKCLVMVDGETELEMETLLKASAYVLGSSGGSIVYKAVVGGGGGGGGGGAGVAFAVRRIAKCGVEKMKDFEKIVRSLSKLRHQNLVTVRGFYWGEEEKLVIYDYVSNGSLASTTYYEKEGLSSYPLSFDIRLKIAKGIAKGLSYIHEKKHVHGNIKPNNILFTSQMDPVISDFGLDWLISGKTNYAIDKSTRNFGSKRSTSSCDQETTIGGDHYHHHHQPANTNAYMALPTSSLHGCATHPHRLLVGYVSPFQAPESINTLKSNPKWDVYSFGIILLKLFTGKVFVDKELVQWNTDSMCNEMDTKILNMANQFTTFDVHGRKDCVLTCLKLGLSCASLVPQKRPSMKEALQMLEKIP
ncbi:hypothetical protein E3N88_34292 [Mikania micrantha]|uniref:Protein kinase domain-containing protein n=1 Tax=Mikania micrantha TaxID=192012 RepID=A0A5N6LY38_9ASTR|nr:hypothetical protein E3N88_34292 [Mikania micrantha]